MVYCWILIGALIIYFVQIVIALEISGNYIKYPHISNKELGKMIWIPMYLYYILLFKYKSLKKE